MSLRRRSFWADARLRWTAEGGCPHIFLDRPHVPPQKDTGFTFVKPVFKLKRRLYLWGTPPPPAEWPAGALCPIEDGMELGRAGAEPGDEDLLGDEPPGDEDLLGELAENCGAGRTSAEPVFTT